MYDSGWSWGAFMFDAPFVIATRNYWYLLVYVTMVIPIANIIIYLGYKIYLGIKGREMAVESETFDSAEERAGFFKAFDWAGKVLFFVMLVFALIGIAFGILAATGVIAPDAVAPGSMPMDPSGGIPMDAGASM